MQARERRERPGSFEALSDRFDYLARPPDLEAVLPTAVQLDHEVAEESACCSDGHDVAKIEVRDRRPKQAVHAVRLEPQRLVGQKQCTAGAAERVHTVSCPAEL